MQADIEQRQRDKALPAPHGSAAVWSGQKLHEAWAAACPWSSVGFERDWEGMHTHRKEKWNELAKIVNGEQQPNDQAHLSAPGGRVERNQKER